MVGSAIDLFTFAASIEPTTLYPANAAASGLFPITITGADFGASAGALLQVVCPSPFAHLSPYSCPLFASTEALLGSNLNMAQAQFGKWSCSSTAWISWTTVICNSVEGSGMDQAAVLIVDSETTLTLGSLFTFDAPVLTEMYD